MVNELKTCAHCKGVAELDYEQPFCAFPSGKMEKQVAIYCTKCDVHMSMCYSDFPEYDHDEMAAILTEKWNTRPAAPVEGLERFGVKSGGISKRADGVFCKVEQAEAIIAAKDASINELCDENDRLTAALKETWHTHGGTEIALGQWKFAAEKAEADNAALTARVKELSDLIDGENCADTDKIDALFRRAETAETQLTAAKDALEIVANAHASNPSLAMADVPEADYVRHVLYEMRKLARAALEDRP